MKPVSIPARVAPALLGALLLATPGASAQRPTIGIWMAPDEIRALPMTGAAWNNVKSAADRALGTPVLNNQDDDTDVYVLAKALVYVRTGNPSYRDDVVRACNAAIG